MLVGIDYFASQAVESSRDSVIHDLNHLASLAQTYYKKTADQGGGGGSYVGFSIPHAIDTTAAGVYTIIYARQNRALLQGVGFEKGDDAFGCGDLTTRVTYQILVEQGGTTLNKIY